MVKNNMHEFLKIVVCDFNLHNRQQATGRIKLARRIIASILLQGASGKCILFHGFTTLILSIAN